jgi:FtsH-binding integral membrane protein
VLAFASSAVLLVALHIKRRESPANLILLAAFTAAQAYGVGVAVTFCDANVAVQAFFLTSAVVVGLTAFTFQSERDFSGWRTGLFAGLWIPILGGLLQIFVGGKLLETGEAMGGAFLSSGFVILDTLAIMHRLSPEEYIVATIDLYLDLLRLFVEILKVLDKIDRK